MNDTQEADDWTFGDEGFVKLYGDKLLQSSLMDEKVVTRWVFVAMLSAADSEGRVRAQTLGALSRLVAVSLQDASEAVAALESPDPRSSTKDFDGRRIKRIEGGWQIISYQKYRAYRTKRQIADAERKRAERAARRQQQPSTPAVETLRNIVSPMPHDRAEAATSGEIRRLQIELGGLITALAEHPRSERTTTDWCRKVTAYTRKDQTKVNGVPDFRTIFSIDRLERSIEDAKRWQKKLDQEG